MRGKYELEMFSKMPDRVKELFFENIVDNTNDGKEPDAVLLLNVKGFDYEFCDSPIEVIFNYAYDLSTISRFGIYELINQCEIEANGHKYIADFCFDTDENSDWNIRFRKPYKLVIECDGHEFHEKTKEQVEKNNQRDYNLKMSGYDVIHFSGSQIFNNPYKCVSDVLRMIIKNTRGYEVIGE